jgi:hypothetical protein
MNTTDEPSKLIVATPKHEGALAVSTTLTALEGDACRKLEESAFEFFTKPSRYYTEDRANLANVQNTFSVMGEYLYNAGIQPSSKEQIARIAEKYISDPKIAEDFIACMYARFDELS